MRQKALLCIPCLNRINYSKLVTYNQITEIHIIKIKIHSIYIFHILPFQLAVPIIIFLPIDITRR